MGIAERREREKKNRQELVINAAMELYNEEGYHAITMEKIAERSELSRAAWAIIFSPNFSPRKHFSALEALMGMGPTAPRAIFASEHRSFPGFRERATATPTTAKSMALRILCLV